MSSTKITEFDLDPNMDMAKESSLQEVKTAVENIPNNLPDDIAKESTSQEILEKVGNKLDNRQFIYSSTTSATAIPVSIKGTGKFYYAHITQAQLHSVSTSPNITITVDGVPVLNCTCSVPSNTAQSVVLKFANWRYQSLDNNLYYLFDVAPIKINSVITDDYFSIDTPFSITDSKTFRVKDYVEFNESFEIKMTGCSTSASTVYFCYSLEE